MFPFHFKLNTMKFPYKKETKLMCFVELLYNVLSKVTHNCKILDNLRSFMPLDNAKEEQIPVMEPIQRYKGMHNLWCTTRKFTFPITR